MLICRHFLRLSVFEIWIGHCYFSVYRKLDLLKNLLKAFICVLIWFQFQISVDSAAFTPNIKTLHKQSITIPTYYLWPMTIHYTVLPHPLPHPWLSTHCKDWFLNPVRIFSPWQLSGFLLTLQYWTFLHCWYSLTILWPALLILTTFVWYFWLSFNFDQAISVQLIADWWLSQNMCLCISIFYGFFFFLGPRYPEDPVDRSLHWRVAIKW